ncbi:MAG: XdhC family protein [Bdellovibrionales bacterium]|nr:XdhC family protein [Bdellovibrionales bacterium]
MKHPWAEAAKLERSGTPFVIVTMIGGRGHAPQDPGAKAIVTADGIHAGTVGGGKVEARCIEEAKKMLAEPGHIDPKTFNWNLQRDIGMTCGGEGTYLFEKIAPAAAWRVIVFGAGHTAQKMARILRMLDCRATFVDSRPEWIQKFPKSSNLEYICMPEPKEYLAELAKEPNVRPSFAIMTRGHATDMPVLREVLRLFPDSYYGIIGSKVKGLKIRNELKAEGYPQKAIDGLRCPMGLPFGKNDPAEISLSIISELIQVRDRLSQRIDE